MYLITPLCKTFGQRVVIAKVGIMPPQVSKPGEDIKWCGDCGRYFNPKKPHECNMKKVRDNQKSLEKWLKRYKVVESG